MSEKTVLLAVLLSRTRRAFWFVIVLVLALSGLGLQALHEAPQVSAATSSTLNFQARLLSATGALVPDGYYNIEFKLYNVASGGTALWTDTRYDQNGATAGQDYRIRVANGYFSVYLGDTTAGGTAFPGTIDWDQELWLTMNIGGSNQTATPTYDGEMNPRLKLTAVPYAFKSAVSANVESADTNAASTNTDNVSVVSGNALGATSNSGNITIDAGTATGTAGQLLFGTSAASALTIGRSGVTTTVQGSASFTGAGTALAVTNNATIGGTLQVTGITTAAGGLTVGNGTNFINQGSTLNSAITITDKPTGGAIGTAAATVDAYTTFNVNQTTASQALTLPSPTTTTAGRIVYINNVGSTSFTMYGTTIGTSGSNAFIWNGSAWITTVSLSGSSVSVIGTIDSQTKSTDGGVISGNALYFQTADASFPGLVSTTTQTFAGAKTFNGNLTVSGSSTFTVGTGLTTLGGGLDVSAGNSTFAGNLVVENTGYLATNRAADFSTTGTTNDANLGNASLVRLTGASTQTLTGIAGGADGRILTVINAAAQAAVLNNNDTNSSAANRIITGSGANLTLEAGASITMIYDSGASVWRVTGSSVSTTGFANTALSNLTTTSINQSLIANANNTLDLGAAGTAWRTVYAGTSVLTPSLDVSSAGTLSIGTSTATAITIGKAGITTTNAGALTVSELLTASLGATVSGAAINLNASSNFNTNINTGSSTGTVAIGNANSTTTVLGSTTINTTGTATTSIGNSSATTTITASSLLLNTATISRTAAGTTTVDLVDGANTTLALLNSGAGVANLTVDGAVTASGLLTANGGLTVEAGDTFTFNGDAFTDLTGSGLTLSSGALTVDDSTATGFFRNGGNSFGATATLGTNDAQSLVLETNNQSAVTIASGGAVTLQNNTDSTAAFTVRGAGGVTYFAVDTSNGQIGTLPTSAAATNSQPVTLRSGQATGSGSNSGSIIIRSGNTNDGTVGNVQIDTGSPSSGSNYGQIYIGSNFRNGGINIGTVGTDNRVSTVNIANTTGTSLQTVNIGSSGNVNNIVNILAGTTGGVNIQTSGGGPVAIGDGTGTFSLSTSNIDISSAGAISGVTGYAQASGNFAQSGAGTFSTGTGAVSLNGATSVTGTNTFTVGTGLTTLGGGLDVSAGNSTFAGNVVVENTGYLATNRAADFSTTGSTNDANLGAASLVRLTGASTQTITGIAGGADGRILTIVNAAAQAAIITNNDGASTAANRISTGTGSNISLAAGSTVTLIYDAAASLWRVVGDVAGGTGLAVTTIGAVDSQTKSANGAVISSSTLYLQTADIDDIGLVSIGTQTFNGVKTFDDGLVVTTGGATITAGALAVDSGSITSSALTLTINAGGTVDIQDNLTVGGNGDFSGTLFAGTGDAFQVSSAGAVTAVGVNAGTGLLQGTGGITVTGAANINATGTAATSIGNGTGTLTVTGSASSTFVLNGVTVDATEFNLLDGRDTALVDVNDAVNTAITGTGALDSGSITANFGSIDTGADNISTTGTVQGTTSVLTSAIDRVTAGTLTIGATTANAITLGQNTTISGSSTFTSGTGLVLLQGNTDVAATASLATRRGTTYTTAGSANDVAISTASLYLLDTSGAAQTITGIVAGRDGQVLTLVNADSSNAVTLTNEDAASSANNRIITGTGGSVTIPAGASTNLIYDSANNRWRVIGSTAVSGGYANTALSNLTTTSINQSLIPNANNTLDLGTSANGWRSLYAATSVLTAGVDTISAGTLTIGNSTATAVSICNSANCDTVTIGNNADADTITIGDSLDTVAINGGLTVLGATTINTTGTATTSIGNSGATTTITASSLLLNTATVSRTAAGTTSIDLVDGANTTLALLNSGAGVANLTVDGAVTTSGLLTTNGGLTVETGDIFTFNGDAFDDLTGTGLTISSGDLSVDTTYFNTNYIQNQSASDQTGDFRVSGTGRANTSFISPAFDSISGGVTLGATTATGVTIGGTTNTTAITVQGAAGATYTIGTSNNTGGITIGNSVATNTIAIGSAAGASATQTINIGTSATASSTTNVNIGSTIAGTVAIQAPATVTNRTSGSADTFIVSNSTSTGTIAIFRDNATAVATIADGGAVTLQNSTNSAAALTVKNVAGATLLGVDTTNAGAVSLLTNSNGETQAWTTTTALAAGVEGHSIVTANGYVYALGGRTASGIQANTYYARINADGTLGSWTATTALAAANYYGGAVAANGYVYYLGGCTNNTCNGNTTANTYYAKINADGTLGSWTATTAITGARNAFAITNYNGYVYVLGGTDNGGTSTQTVYHAKLNSNGTLGSWTTSGNTLPAINRLMNAVVANGYVYVVGGALNNGANSNAIVYAKLNSDGTVGTWTTNANNMPASLRGVGAAVLNGHLYAIGGDSTTSDSTAVNTIYYATLNSNGSTGTFSTSANTLGTAVESPAVFTANGYLYSLGGWSSSTRVATAQYATGKRVSVGGSLDLVGANGENLGEGNNGGQLTAGDTRIVGLLDVQDAANFWSTLTVQRDLTVNGDGNFNGNLTIGRTPGLGQLTNNGSTQFTSLALGDLAAGAIGTAAATVDAYTSFTISPTASGRTYTIPAPTSGAAGRLIYISNINASNTFIIGSTTFGPHSTATFVYDGSTWNFAGMDGGSNNYIQNQTAADQSASFRIAGSGQVTQASNASALSITANAITTANAVSIASTSTTLTTGSLLNVSSATTGAVATNGIISLSATGNYTSTANAGLLNVAANSTTAGTITNVSGNALTTGVGVNIGSTGTGLTSGSLLRATTATTGAIATNGAVSFQATGNYTSTANVGLLSVQANTTTAGTIQNISGNALTTGQALYVSSSSTGLTSGSLIFATTATTGAVATNGVVSIQATGNYTSTANTGLLNVLANSTAAGTITNIQGNALTTGVGLNVTSTGTGLTTGSLINVSSATTGAVATNGIVSINATGNYTSTSNVGLLNVAANATTAGTVQNVTANALTTGNALRVTSSGTGLTSGSLLFVSSATTGAVATNGVVSVQASANYTSTSNVGLLSVQANSTTAGTIQNISGNALTTGQALYVSSTSTGLTTGSLIYATTATTGALATNGVVSIQATGNYTSTSNTGVLNVLANSTTAGTIANISGTALTTGIALNINAGAGIAINAAGTSTLTGPAGSANTTLTINNSTGTGNVLSAQDNGTNVLVVADGGNLGVKTGANSITSAYDITIGDGANRTIGVLTRTTNAAGNNLTIAAGAAGAGASPFSGGIITIQGGNAAGTGNANGGNVALTGGTGTGTGVLGLVSLAPTYFLSSGSPQAFATSGSVTGVDSFSTISINATAGAVTVTVPVPNATNQVVGRIIYITAASTSSDFTLALANTSGSAPSYTQIGMKANNTATLIWNGFAWTAAGASSSTDLQSAYNNTLTSAGGAEIVLAANGGAVDGLTIRNNATTPIIGGIFEVQSSIGTNLFSVNNLTTEYAANGGGEDSTNFSTNWTTLGTSTISRTTTSGQFATGIAATSVAAGTTAGNGVRQNLGTNPATSTVYMISFTARLASGSPAFTDLRVDYTPTGAATGTQCAASQTIVTTGWTRITCEVTTPGTAVTNPDVLIYQVAGPGSARTWYVDNFSMTLADDAGVVPNNVQIGGGIYGGAPTLFTLDRSSGPPVANGNTTYLGSMYYDTVTGRIQCYESDGWGACGSAPNNYVNLVPEYPGSVLNGSGVGTMTADFCAEEALPSNILNVNTAFCDEGESKNFYRWTSPQATQQTYSIYITYQLPAAFKNFDSDSTVTLTARTSSTTNGVVTFEMFRNEGGAIAACGTETTVTTVANTWQTVGINGNESTGCGFTTASADDFVIFKINMKANSNASVYASTLSFTTVGQ